VSLAAVPGRRRRTLELAKEIEDRGFAGIYGPSYGDVMGLCVSLAHTTEHIPFGTTILPIYLRHPYDLAQAASYVAELSDGRFRLGLGVSHGDMNQRLGVQTGKPLSDMRDYLDALKRALPVSAARSGGRSGPAPAPPIILATLRTKMLQLAAEAADGAVFANAARSHMKASLGAIDKPDGFFVGNMIPTVITDDRAAAATLLRRALASYAERPNYRNYWHEAGYDDGEIDGMSDRWLEDVTLFGTASDVRDGVEAWMDAGVDTPILVPSSTSGGQLQAMDELFAAFAR
jgi:probable F420-dependent oxidoreductase